MTNNQITDEEKIKEMKRAYKRKWYRKNKDKAKAAQDRYWKKKLKELEA